MKTVSLEAISEEFQEMLQLEKMWCELGEFLGKSAETPSINFQSQIMLKASNTKRKSSFIRNFLIQSLADRLKLFKLETIFMDLTL